MSSPARTLDLQLLRTFVTAAHHGSMTVAANVLHLTQGAISQQIRRLEDQLGCVLFEREARGLRLSAAGERLRTQATRLLGLHDEIWRDMTDSPISGPVRLGVPHDLVSSFLPPVLKAYTQAFPQVELSLATGSSPDLGRTLARGELDLALLEEAIGPSSGTCLRVEPLVWVGARGGLAHRKDPIPLSLVVDTCAFRPVILEALQQQGRRWKAVFENGNLDATAATVRADLAVTAWLASTVPADLDILDRSAQLPPLPSFAINLHLPRHTPSPAALELAAHLRAHLQRHG